MYGNSIDNLTHAISKLTEAQIKYEEEYRKCSGSSWGWASQHLKEKIEQAEKEIETALEEIVDNRIKKILIDNGLIKQTE